MFTLMPISIYICVYIDFSYVVRLLIHAVHQGHADSGPVMGSLPDRKPDKHAGKPTIGQIMDRQLQRQTHIMDSILVLGGEETNI